MSIRFVALWSEELEQLVSSLVVSQGNLIREVEVSVNLAPRTPHMVHLRLHRDVDTDP
jgi:subtilisin-like proprotein convertase family protein